MQLQCASCSAVLTYQDDDPPRFCSRCGSSLTAQKLPTSTGLEATGVYTPDNSTYISDRRISSPYAGIPEQVGGYRLLRKLGSGGMGTVFEAEDMANGQKVALKLIKRGSDLSDSSAQRFKQEGRLASSISHPRCVFVLAADEEHGQPYIVMELMPGRTFVDHVREKSPLPVTEAVTLILDIIDGLQEAHRLGLVHRDVKPANCFIDEQGRAKVGDFGLAKVLDQRGAGDVPTAVELTGTGAFIGTPLYAAPEQIKGHVVDQQVDVYSVGATLYFLLSGKAPFEDQQSVTAVLARIVSEDPVPLGELRKDLPPGLEAIIRQALERDRHRRFRDLESLRQALTVYLPGRARIVRFGQRIAAFTVDFVITMIIAGITALGFSIYAHASADESLRVTMDSLFEESLLGSIMITLFAHTLVFIIPESLWATTFGKWCFRLRLSSPSDGSKPRPRQVIVRNIIFLCISMLLFWVTLALGLNTDTVKVKQSAAAGKQVAFQFDIADPTLSNIVGLLILCSTMRRSNGYRGLHELLSSTSTIWLPPLPTRSELKFNRQAASVPPQAQPLPTPMTLGGFTVTHQLWASDEQTVYVGRDERLSRNVWIWMRPLEFQKLDAARRKLSRPTRWRWIASGQHEGRAWDAFLATAGFSLQNLVDQQQTLDWTATFHVLTDCAEELDQAQSDRTIPTMLSPSQLWIQSRGSTQWLDVPISRDVATTSVPSQSALLEFLGRVSRLALEGPMMLAGNLLQKPIPVGGYNLINRLLGEPPAVQSFSELRTELKELSFQPFYLTRWARFRSIVVQAMWLVPAAIFSLAITLGLAYLLVLSSDKESLMQSWNVMVKSISPWAGPAAGLIIMAIWSYAFRGKLSFGLVGLEVRRFDGAPVECWRMALRTLCLATPILLFLLISSYFEWTIRWREMIIRVNQLPVPVFVFLTFFMILRRPDRIWFDKLAGTVVVPK
ncbi:MAG: protein kinase [Planctomycetia bacterium]|nr:protein kinase [Planctomycetia bacterium]